MRRRWDVAPPRARVLRTCAATLVTIVLTCAALLTSEAMAKAKLDPRIFDPSKKAFGKPMNAWAVEWYQWAASIPTAVNPLADTTGEFAEVGQRGPVWFLAGPYTTSVIVRTATIPTGKALFFPLINGGQDHTNYGQVTPLGQMQNDAEQFLSLMTLTNTSIELDGTPITQLERWRILTDPYDFALPANNYYEDAGIVAPRGIYSPAVGFGHWMMLKPLDEGDHTLHFRSEQSSPSPFAFDVTYHLKVVERNRP